MAFAYQPLLGPVGAGGANSINANVGACQIAGGAVAVRAQRRFNANVGEIILTGQSAEYERQMIVAADAGCVEYNGLECIVLQAQWVSASAGGIAIYGSISTPKLTRRCIADQAEFILSVIGVDLRRYRSFSPLDATVAFVATSGQSSGIAAARRLLASEGVITVNGKSATVYRNILGGGGTPPAGAPVTASISIAIGL